MGGIVPVPRGTPPLVLVGEKKVTLSCLLIGHRDFLSGELKGRKRKRKRETEERGQTCLVTFPGPSLMPDLGMGEMDGHGPPTYTHAFLVLF